MSHESAYFVGCIDPRTAKGHHNAIKSLGVAGRCYMHLNAAGAASLGVIRSIVGEAKLANASTVILTIHSDCKKCTKDHARMRNLRINVALARRLLKGKTIVAMNIGIDGSFHRLSI